MKTCEKYAALLDMYVDGFCTEEESEQVRQHLAECEECRMYVEQILQMKEAFPDAEETEVPDGFAEGVMAVIRAEAAPRKKQMKAWQKTLLQMAACIALVIALGPLSERLTGGGDAAMEMATGTSTAYAPQSPAAYSAGATTGGDTENAAVVHDSVKDNSEKTESTTAESKSSGGATEPYEGSKRTFARTAEVKITRQQMDELLSGYQGEEKGDGIAYVLTPAEFNAVLAKIPEDAFVPGSDLSGEGEDSCLLMVYPTE